MTLAKGHSLRDAAARPRLQATAVRRASELRGRVAELVAAGLLILKGYRILARRLRGPFGEIDIVAVRGGRIAFVEVKQRIRVEDAAASISARQANRMSDAAERWLWRNPRYRDHRVGLDAVVMGASLVPRHLPDALHAW